MVSYCTALNNVLKAIFPRVKAALPQPLVGILHKLQPGDWVVVKDLRRKHWNQQRWTGPYQVMLITPTAVHPSHYSCHMDSDSRTTGPGKTTWYGLD
ncbi:unnamed protein product [Oncorhynchus mykiss]|uniref:Murine leukemia virus integrase C-terminal domain-containing protein n=1 Tax=Oncorhynchus mykiss TaxID=8022 RepID=A0A060XYU0_ONCMY|nr:unnamed protein product [Oncorhynchus mykiss]